MVPTSMSVPNPSPSGEGGAGRDQTRPLTCRRRLLTTTQADFAGCSGSRGNPGSGFHQSAVFDSFVTCIDIALCGNVDPHIIPLAAGV